MRVKGSFKYTYVLGKAKAYSKQIIGLLMIMLRVWSEVGRSLKAD